MSDNQAYSWAQLVPGSPAYPTYSSGSSNFSPSPSWGNASLAASSPSPLGGQAIPLPPPFEALLFNYDALLQTHLPYLRHEFRHNQAASETLQRIINGLIQSHPPEDSLINPLIINNAGRYYCSIRSCERHTKPFTRSDRAREHFRTEHLAAYFPCTWSGCSSRFRRVADLRAHVLRHSAGAPTFDCDYCGLKFPKKGNLHRHMEGVHQVETIRRIRGN